MEAEELEELCHVCLRTDRDLRRIDEQISKFHYELCEISMDSSVAQYCYQCEHLVKKSYNFKQRCLQSIQLLYISKGTPLDQLHWLIPQSSINYSNKEDSVIILYDNKPSKDTKQDLISTLVKKETVGPEFDVVLVREDLKSDPNIPTDLQDPITIKPDLNGLTENRNRTNDIDVEETASIVSITVNEDGVPDQDLDHSDDDFFKDVTQDNIDDDDKESETLDGLGGNGCGNLNNDGDNLGDDILKVERKSAIIAVRQPEDDLVKKLQLNNVNVRKVKASLKRPAPKDIKATRDTHENVAIGQWKPLRQLGAAANKKKKNGEDNKILQAEILNLATTLVIKRGSQQECIYNSTDENEDCKIQSTSKSKNTPEMCNNVFEYEITDNESTYQENNKILANTAPNITHKTNDESDSIEETSPNQFHNYFHCDACTFKCVSKYSLVKHMRFHDMNRCFECEVCHYRFASKERLKVHHSKHSIDSKKYDHDICGYNTFNKMSMRRHIFLHSNVRNDSCDKCDYKSAYPSTLKMHMLKHTKQTVIASNHRDLKSPTEHALAKHIQAQHLNYKRYHCNGCDYKCALKPYLARHMRKHLKNNRKTSNTLAVKDAKVRYNKTVLNKDTNVHVTLTTDSNKTMYYCNECNYKSEYKWNVTRHMRVNANRTHIEGNSDATNRPHKCSKCDYKCKNPNNLKMHTIKHSNDHKFYSCKQCNYRSLWFNYLMNHIERIHEIYEFSCYKCDFSSFSKVIFKLHLKTHSNVQHACIKCDYKSPRRDHLINHIKKNHKNYEYDCDHCDYKSLYLAGFTTHLKIHNVHLKNVQTNATAPHTTLRNCEKFCNYCNFKTTHLTNLKIHIRTYHTKENPFVCDVCGYKCFHTGNFKIHARKHTNDFFLCNVCGYETSYKSNLNTHMRKHTEANERKNWGKKIKQKNSSKEK